MTTRRFSTAFLILLAALLTTAGLSFALATPAQAHSELISSSPTDGEESYTPPDVITLEFNETIQDIGNEIVVTGPSGADVADGAPEIDGPLVTQALAASQDPEGAIGTYTVTWRVVSADGHPISGEFTFEVLRGTVGDTVTEESTTDEATTAEAEETEADAESATPISGDVEEDQGSDAALPIIIGVVALAVVVAVVLVIRRKRAR